MADSPKGHRGIIVFKFVYIEEPQHCQALGDGGGSRDVEVIDEA